jgi:hypothetical protein
LLLCWVSYIDLPVRDAQFLQKDTSQPEEKPTIVPVLAGHLLTPKRVARNGGNSSAASDVVFLPFGGLSG